MNIVGRFHAALTLELSWWGPDLLPAALAHASAQVLPVTAVGFGLVDGDHRTPLGASSSEAVVAEQWEFTLGDDPFRAAVEQGQPVVATEVALRRRWLDLHTELRRHTPFRSVVALPLGHGAAVLGAVALYFEEASPGPDFDVDAARVVAALLHRELLDATPVVDPSRLGPRAQELPSRDGPRDHVDAAPGPGWMDGPAARERQNVWVAVGRCIGALGLDSREALGLLRACARTQGVTLDVLALDVVSGRVPVETLQGS